MGNPVLFLEIAGKNSELLSDFYRNVFDWTILPMGWKTSYFPNDIYGVDPTPPPLTDQGIKGHILPLDGSEEMNNRVSIFIQVDDIFQTLELIKNMGGEVFVEPQILPENMGSIAMFIDPSGNTVGLYQM